MINSPSPFWKETKTVSCKSIIQDKNLVNMLLALLMVMMVVMMVTMMMKMTTTMIKYFKEILPHLIEHIAYALDDGGDGDEDDGGHFKEILPHLIEHVACALDCRGRVGGFALETFEILIQKKIQQFVSEFMFSGSGFSIWKSLSSILICNGFLHNNQLLS